MRISFPLIAILIASALLPAAARADDAGRFDGTWNTVLSCENSHGALGYSYQFPSTVKDGVLHGEKGEKDKPGWLQIDGKIDDDGAANFYASGLVGGSAFAVGDRPEGTPYNYHIDAKFSDTTGTGHRVEGRPCTVGFTREK